MSAYRTAAECIHGKTGFGGRKVECYHCEGSSTVNIFSVGHCYGAISFCVKCSRCWGSRCNSKDKE